MKILVGKDEIHYELQGEEHVDGNGRLIDKQDDLSTDCDWHHKGYKMLPLFDNTNYYRAFTEKVSSLLYRKIKKGGVNLDGLSLDRYHRSISNYNEHLAVIEETKLIQADELAPYFDQLEVLVSTICGLPLQSTKPYNGERVFHFRLIRPNQLDFNPLHKDAWLDELRDCINIYIPICGSNEHSSLLLAEASHLLSEDEFVRTKHGAIMNGVQYNVPGLIDCKSRLKFVRPNPGPNQMLIFSPYLIHGGSVNHNTDQTRISLEMRFWRKN
ncbi:MAG: hypothetical protein ABJF11_17230 [Reichenbachiella sp.]|uniref:hypothetical protein n=1 Tax=Reichenbachiella sp. TaxID=2184521 RepID=UPI0032637A79